MYSRLQLAKKYLFYYFHSENGKGHGIHSPFVYDFIKNVLNDKAQYPAYKIAESRRKELLKDDTFIEVEDFGAGSGIIKTNKRQISRIAASSLKPAKYAQLLFRMVKYYQPDTIIELGTSFGTTAAYMASAGNTIVYTLEGARNIAAIAQQTFNQLALQNIKLITGPFEKTIPPLLDTVRPGLTFIDGHHTKEATMRYFEYLLSKSDSSAIFILDDIHWSAEMEQAWEIIKIHPAVKMTIDLFFMGIVLFRQDFKVKQHFIIRF